MAVAFGVGYFGQPVQLLGWAHAVRAQAKQTAMKTVGKTACPPYQTSIFINPGFSGKKPVIEQPGVETFQRSFPRTLESFARRFAESR